MFKNYIKIAFRNLIKYKSHTIINVLGLAIGLAATILILLYIHFELSFDSFHTNADNIYRISIVHKQKDIIEYDSPQFTPPIGPAMKNDFPEVENFARISVLRSSYIKTDNRILKVNGIRHASPGFLEIFTFPVIEGNPATMLSDPFSLVLTQPTAKRLFGEENAIGRMVEMDDGDLYRITGILKSPPENSHLKFNALISFSTMYNQSGWYMDWNGGNQYITYVKLFNGVNANFLNKKFPDFLWKYINKDYSTIGVKIEAYLQPLRDIHLYYSDSLGMLKIFILTSIALLILIMACINYINLGTARSGIRAREVGVRKVLGADKSSLIGQFLTESIIVTIIALVMAVLLVELIRPVYYGIIGYQTTLYKLYDPLQMAGLLLIIIIVGIVSGAYPAFYLSSIQPINSLKGIFKTGKSKTRTRNTLVVVQFLISITLIIITIAVNAQLSFMRSKDLGFNKDQILVLPLPGEKVQNKGLILKEELLRLPGVKYATASSEIPIRNFTSNGYIPEGHESPIMIHVVHVDEDFLKTFDIQLIRGRNFYPKSPTDKTAYLINEALAKTLGWDNPLGKSIRRNGDHQIIGEVQDFHYATFYNKIEPLIISHQPERNRYQNLSLKIYPNRIAETLKSVESKWNQLVPDKPFEFWFLDESFDNLYRMERKFENIFFYFSLVALAIALLGLYSLVSFSTDQRTKEIGIRIILGASTLKIVNLISKEYLGLVLIANVIAWPVAWIVLKKIFQHFAYKIELGIWIFLLAGVIAFTIALITLSFQTVKAAMTNPVDALRYE
jgi:putative ABC transport system permease protein